MQEYGLPPVGPLVVVMMVRLSDSTTIATVIGECTAYKEGLGIIHNETNKEHVDDMPADCDDGVTAMEILYMVMTIDAFRKMTASLGAMHSDSRRHRIQ